MCKIYYTIRGKIIIDIWIIGLPTKMFTKLKACHKMLNHNLLHNYKYVICDTASYAVKKTSETIKNKTFCLLSSCLK